MRFWHNRDTYTYNKNRPQSRVDRPALFCIAIICFSLLISGCIDSRDAKTKDDKAPLFVLADADGKRVALEDFRGKIVILEFFATWCEPCYITAKSLQALSEKYKNRGVVVMGIALDEGDRAPAKVKAFMKELGVAYTIALDNGKTVKQYGAYALPTTFVIDRQGRIRNSHLGIAGGYSKKISEEIEAAMN
jgi:peroxiredoxin